MLSPRFCHIIVLLSLGAAAFAEESINAERNHKKRQIYREQVLPHAGGKIPDTAFETDRLFLNRLQKEGISVPDGIVPEQRNPQVYQYYNKPMRTVYHIALSSDGRYTPREGRYQYRQVPSVETTYLYPQAVGHPYVFVPPKHALPSYRQLQLHNPLLNQVKFQHLCGLCSAQFSGTGAHRGQEPCIQLISEGTVLSKCESVAWPSAACLQENRRWE